MKNRERVFSGSMKKTAPGSGRFSMRRGPALSEGGSVVTEIILMGALLVFIILPVFSSVIEKYILMEKSRAIRDTVDVTNISAYNALAASELGRDEIDADQSHITELYKKILSINLKLDAGMQPEPHSIAEGKVEILSVEVYSDGFPVVCPDGTVLTRPSIHSSISVPVRPSLYRGIILNMLGKDHIDIVVHVDSEIPVNN